MQPPSGAPSPIRTDTSSALRPYTTQSDSEESGEGRTHLLRVEAEHLEAVQRRRPRERNVALALLEHAPEVDLDVLDRLALALVYRHRPGKDERELRGAVSMLTALEHRYTVRTDAPAHAARGACPRCPRRGTRPGRRARPPCPAASGTRRAGRAPRPSPCPLPRKASRPSAPGPLSDQRSPCLRGSVHTAILASGHLRRLARCVSPRLPS